MSNSRPPIPGHEDDVIDHLAGIAPDSALDRLRRLRPELRENIQRSFHLLLHPDTGGDVSLLERRIVAAYVAGLHGENSFFEFYESLLLKTAGASEVTHTVRALASASRTRGPYGDYPAGPLSRENLNGLASDISPTGIGHRLASALTHAHLLVFHPRDASQSAIDRLLAAGWSATAIVTLSQLVAFLAFQVRIVHGLSALRNAAVPGETSS